MPNEIDWRLKARRSIAAALFPRSRFEPEPFPDANSLQQRIERQRALFSWLAFEREFEFLVTIQFGEELREHQITTAVKRMGALLDSYWLGREWARRASAERAFFVATIERGKENGHSHIHMLVRRPSFITARAMTGSWREELQARCLTHVFSELGRRKGVCPHGDVRVDRLQNEDDQVRVASYILKDLGERNSTGVIVSSEFHPRHSESPVTATRD